MNSIQRQEAYQRRRQLHMILESCGIGSYVRHILDARLTVRIPIEPLATNEVMGFRTIQVTPILEALLFAFEKQIEEHQAFVSKENNLVSQVAKLKCALGICKRQRNQAIIRYRDNAALVSIHDQEIEKVLE